MREQKEDVETMSADELKNNIERLLEQNMEYGIEVDMMASYLLALKDSSSPSRKTLCEALYYVLSSGYEIRLFLDSMRTASEQGKYSNLYKYLAIQLYESQSTTPKLVSEIWKSVTSDNEVDVSKVKNASRRFSKDLKDQVRLLKLDKELGQIRHHAGAHHLAGNNIAFLLEINSLNRGSWGQGAEFYNNAIVALGLYTCVILNNLNQDLRAADKSGTIKALDEYILFAQNNEDYLSEHLEINKRFKSNINS